jgi:hypothetical protein
MEYEIRYSSIDEMIKIISDVKNGKLKKFINNKLFIIKMILQNISNCRKTINKSINKIK